MKYTEHKRGGNLM